MSKMFKTITSTWNPFTGCRYACSYCWARKLAEGKLKKSYPNGFIPTTHPDRFDKRFQVGEFVFVCSMGDISFAPSVVWDKICITARNHTKTDFLLCTKNPAMYINLGKDFPPNVYHGCTIETNRVYPKSISKAPSVDLRYAIMASLETDKRFLSIEPIMDFDLDIFSTWIYDIDPEIVEIGADNYKNNLPEPSWDKISNLIEILTLHGVKVIQKEGLERLKLPVPKEDR